MSGMTREELIKAVEGYFGSVDRGEIEKTLGYFVSEAEFTIQSAFVTHKGRDSGVKRMFQDFIGAYPQKIWHGNFKHIVDVEKSCISSQFDVELIAGDGARTTLSNCNFFYLENGLFKRVFVYMSGENVLK